MNINKQQVVNLLEEFKSSEKKDYLQENYLSEFDLTKPEDVLQKSFFEAPGEHYMALLHYFITNLKPSVVVELGNREGLSTIAMFDAIKQIGGELYTIDIEEDLRYCNQEMLGDPSLRVLYGDVCSSKIIEQLPKSIDILFTDTLHFDYQLRDEWSIYQHLLADTALVAIDDININDKGRLFQELPYDKWDLTELCHSSGWGLFLYQRKEHEKVDRTLLLTQAIAQVWERKYESLFSSYDQLNQSRVTNRLKSWIKKHRLLYKFALRVHRKMNLVKHNTINYSGSVRS